MPLTVRACRAHGGAKLFHWKRRPRAKDLPQNIAAVVLARPGFEIDNRSRAGMVWGRQEITFTFQGNVGV